VGDLLIRLAVTGRAEVEITDQVRECGRVSYLSKEKIHEHIRDAIFAALLDDDGNRRAGVDDLPDSQVQ
jgi:hypothetical protein